MRSEWGLNERSLRPEWGSHSSYWDLIQNSFISHRKAHSDLNELPADLIQALISTSSRAGGRALLSWLLISLLLLISIRLMSNWHPNQLNSWSISATQPPIWSPFWWRCLSEPGPHSDLDSDLNESRVLIFHILIYTPKYSSSWPWKHAYEETRSELGPNLDPIQVWF